MLINLYICAIIILTLFLVERCIMAVCYNKLWKLLIDRKMKKKDLAELSGVSKATIAKMGNDVNVSTEVLARICSALQVDVGDIMEMVPDNRT